MARKKTPQVEPEQSSRTSLPVEKARIDEFARPAYLAYAMSVVKSRAIPDVEDGLKPVQRRILYAMQQLGLVHPAKPAKCARVVGDVIGKYHPHGDSAVYEAMVRMAQPFSLRYPLVSGEGNFGSRDGDNAAAMRYTEARLAPISAALLDELSHDTVDYRPNYDNAQTEPVTLPSRLPFALLNGASGIGVGMATELLSHNLREVVAGAKLLLSKPKATLDELMEHIPGPDFATGACLISSPAEIRKVYDEGRGSLRLRARWVVEPVGKSWRLVFLELPQPSSTKDILEQVEELINPKQKERDNKKIPLSAEQQRLKRLFGDLVEKIVDGSDDRQPIRLVIEPKDKKVDPDTLALMLCAHTGLEVNVSPNMVMVDDVGTPRQSSLIDWLGQWCSYRIVTVRRRLEDTKARLDHRLHILAGRISILDRIHEVVRMIQDSPDPKSDLMSKYKLTEIQAEDVLEMRLRQLANLEKTKILDEQRAKQAESDKIGKILDSDKAIRKLIITELDADNKAFGDDRRTRLEPSEAANVRKQMEAGVSSARLAPEPVAIALTERGWISWHPAKSMEEALQTEFKIKTGDEVKRIFFADRATDQLFLIDQTGRAYSLRLMDLTSKSDTSPLTQWFNSPAPIVEAATGNDKSRFIVAGSSGYGFIVNGAAWSNRMSAGKAFLTLADGDVPLPPLPLSGDEPATARVVTLSSEGKSVSFPLSELKVLPKGKGVGLMGLAKGSSLKDLALVAEGGTVLIKAQDKHAKIGPDDWGSVDGARSSSKKGRALHKLAANGYFIRPGR